MRSTKQSRTRRNSKIADLTNFTIAAVFVALFWTAAILIPLTREDDEEQDGKSTVCRNERILLEIWTATHVVDEITQDGADIIVRVHTRQWLNRHRHEMISIGMAAYCEIAVAGKGGTARIIGIDGTEHGRVADGKWSSKLTGD